MSFRPVIFKAFFSAGLMLGFCLAAKAQSPPEQAILSTTPDGESVSNTLLPAVQMPGQQEAPDESDEQSTFSFPSMPQQRFATPMPLSRQSPEDAKDMDELRKSMGIQTPAELMGVPSMRSIFGLPEHGVTNSTSYTGTETNSLLSADDMQSGQSDMAKILSTDSDPFGSTKAENSNSMASGFFDNTSLNDNLFQEKKRDDFNSPDFAQIAAQQQQQEQQLEDNNSSAQIVTPLTTPIFSPDIAPAPTVAAAPDFNLNSPSPFALPRPAMDSLPTAPQLPTLPGIANQDLAPSQPATPSWAPKPPPWEDSVPPLGTMAQRKF
jgi:hypothetical protein